MEHSQGNAVVIAGRSQPAFARSLADCAGLPYVEAHIECFPDGETSVAIGEELSGKLVFVVQTLAHTPNNFLVELLLLIDAAKRVGARKVVVILPYYGYARQDRRDRLGVPISARVVAQTLEGAGAGTVLTVDLHSAQIEGFFSIPAENFSATPLLAEEVVKQRLDNLIVVAPDIGSVKIARRLATCLDVDFAIVDKHRLSPERVESGAIIGDVNGKNVLLADDVCSTGETLLSAANACQGKGAKAVFAAVTHGLFVGDAVEKLAASPIETMWVTDTIPWFDLTPHPTRCVNVSVAPLLAQAADRLVRAEGFTTAQAV